MRCRNREKAREEAVPKSHVSRVEIDVYEATRMYKRDVEKFAGLGAEVGRTCHTLVKFAVIARSKCVCV